MKHQLRFWTLLFVLLFVLAWMLAPEQSLRRPPDTKPTVTREPFTAKTDGGVTLRVLRGGAVEEMTMAEYLLGVLRAEMPASFEFEALKAQVTAARTYTYHKMAAGEIAAHPEADACDDITCCKAYKSAAEAAQDWGSMALYYEEKLARAVAETDGEVIVYDGEPVLAVFFSSSGGYTQPAGDVWLQNLPYLQSVTSPEEESVMEEQASVVTFTVEEFCAAIRAVWIEAKFGTDARGYVESIERNEAGYVTALTVGGVRVKGNDFRAALGLRSPNFTLEATERTLTFHVTGYGHGVGMSQYGANAMARSGADAKTILEHYFPGAAVEKRGA